MRTLLTGRSIEGNSIRRRRSAPGAERSQEVWRIEAYLLLWATAEKSGWNAGFERMEGSLLGYEDWQNDVHLARWRRPGSADRESG